MLSVISLLLNPTDWKYQYSNRLNGNPHSSTLAWKIPWTEEPGRLQSMELQRVGYGWVTSFSLAGSSGMFCGDEWGSGEGEEKAGIETRSVILSSLSTAKLSDMNSYLTFLFGCLIVVWNLWYLKMKSLVFPTSMTSDPAISHHLISMSFIFLSDLQSLLFLYCCLLNHLQPQ